MEKEKILQKAKDILAKKNKDKEHIEICVKAGICPECGENLIERNVTAQERERQNIWTVTECSKNNKHYQEKEYFDDNDDYN
jgi:predicted RNA-binding Zn-ribbon protein involved in translation (DUF1610 family)